MSSASSFEQATQQAEFLERLGYGGTPVNVIRIVRTVRETWEHKVPERPVNKELRKIKRNKTK